MLNHSQARQIAEAMWGRGGTNSRPTQRPGAFYFSCSGHGGFIIDAKAINPNPEYPEPEEYRLYGNKLWWAGRRTTLRTRHEPLYGKYYAFEEDCDWCLPVKFAGIWPEKRQVAEEAFVWRADLIARNNADVRIIRNAHP